ncbi:MAG: hypothetical protein MK009_01080 [Gammaproteobacteria bacterium]|nr:hypothetical protein [Gammaproteobacteria bacterium]
MKHIQPLLLILFLCACGGGGSEATDTVIGMATNTANQLAAEEHAKALAAATALQDAANQAQQTALKKFGSGKFGQSTFQ